MLQFIPFEDDWDALERLRPEDLIPYRVGLLPEPALSARSPRAFVAFRRVSAGRILAGAGAFCPAAPCCPGTADQQRVQVAAKYPSGPSLGSKAAL